MASRDLTDEDMLQAAAFNMFFGEYLGRGRQSELCCHFAFAGALEATSDDEYEKAKQRHPKLIEQFIEGRKRKEN